MRLDDLKIGKKLTATGVKTACKKKPAKVTGESSNTPACLRVKALGA